MWHMYPMRYCLAIKNKKSNDTCYSMDKSSNTMWGEIKLHFSNTNHMK